MQHWAEKYIGKPYQKGAYGPEYYDCWGFVKTVMETEFDREVPDLAMGNITSPQTRAVLACWGQTYNQKEGTVVVLCKNPKELHHVGVWLDIDDGGVLHCVEGAGVVFQTLADLQAAGWSTIKYYNYKK